MKVLWICGLPNVVRLNATDRVLSGTPTAAWSWILGHIPPPADVELHIVCPVGGLIESRIDFNYGGAYWHCFRQERFEILFLWHRFAHKIRPFVRSLVPDIIHGWGGETGCGRVATLLTRDAIVSVQGLLLLFWQLLKIKGERQKIGFRNRLVWHCEQRTYKKAKKLLVESEASRRGLKEYYGKDAVLVPHPLRPEFLSCDLIHRDSLYQAPIKFVYLGSLIDRKGAVDAVKAFAAISHVNVQLCMIGEGKQRKEIETFIERHELANKVKLKGIIPVENIVKEFSDAQFFLLPTYGDTGPTALKEALACGLYPICYDNSGPHDLISHYKCGMVVKTADIQGLAEAMRKCISNVDECVQKGIRAAQIVRGELSRSNVWKRLSAIYNANTSCLCKTE